MVTNIDPKSEVRRALALQVQGRAQEAQAILGNLLSRYATQPQVLSTLGATLAEAGAADQGIAFLQHAVAQRPKDPSILNNFASALAAVFNFDVAIDALERAIAIDPNLQLAWHNLARVLNLAGAPRRALQLAQRAKAKTPDQIGAYLNIVRSLTQLGEFAEAEAAALEIINRWPDRAAGYVVTAPLKHFTAGDPIIAAARRIADHDTCERYEVGDLHFALGKMYDDIGDVEEAFRAFKTANGWNPPSYDRADIESRYEEIAFGYSDALLQRRRDHGYASKVPVLIVGMPRSGTTLVESAVASHPKVGSVGEANFLRHCGLLLGDFAPRLDDFPSTLRSLSQEAVEFLGHRYVQMLERTVSDSSKTRIVDKMPHNFTNLGLAALTLRDVKIIHVRRSPMATALSCWMQNFNTTHQYAARFEDIAHHYHEYRKLMAHWSDVLGDRILHVDYQDVVNDPGATAKKMFDWLGLPADNLQLEKNRSLKVVTTASAWQVRQPVHEHSVDRWRAYEPHLAPLKAAFEKYGIDVA